MHTHIQETSDELNNSIQNNKGPSCHLSEQHLSPIANLARMGVLDDIVAAHCVHMTEEDIQLMAKHHGSIVHNPKSNLKLDSGICPVQHALDEGVNVCLGTDGAASNNSLDMLSELQYAALLGKYRANEPTALSAATAIEMATLNGAKALKLADKIGSIEINKYADVIAINLDEIETCPHFNALSSIVYSANKSQVKEQTKKWTKTLSEFKASKQ
ncbi:hypothetical protein WA158_004833 [Blastocystis sp. Blastoise]